MAAQLATCSLSEPCYQEGCGACYPDKVMQQEMAAQQRAVNANRLAAERADKRAGLAFRRGDYTEALGCLQQARLLDPNLPEVAEHLARVRTAERAAAAEVAKARDLGEVADSFGERTQRWLAQRDRNRTEPDQPCDTPQGGGQCGEPGHLYRDGRRCDEHRPRAVELAEQPWEPAESSLATYVPAQKEYRDLSHGHPEHECILPDNEPGQ